jgi:hypothetical protein
MSRLERPLIAVNTFGFMGKLDSWRVYPRSRQLALLPLSDAFSSIPFNERIEGAEVATSGFLPPVSELLTSSATFIERYWLSTTP